jgi:hypothetical protein
MNRLFSRIKTNIYSIFWDLGRYGLEKTDPLPLPPPNHGETVQMEVNHLQSAICGFEVHRIPIPGKLYNCTTQPDLLRSHYFRSRLSQKP